MKPTQPPSFLCLAASEDGRFRPCLAWRHKKRSWSHLTNDPQPRQLKPQIWPEHVVRSARDKCARSCAWPPRELHRPCEQHNVSQSHRSQTEQSRVDGCAMKQCQTVCDNFRLVSWGSGSCTHHHESTPSQPTPALEHAARWWLKGIQGTATAAQTERAGEGGGEHRVHPCASMTGQVGCLTCAGGTPQAQPSRWRDLVFTVSVPRSTAHMSTALSHDLPIRA